MLGKLMSLASDNLVALKNYGSFFMKTMAMHNTAAAFLMNNSIFVEPKQDDGDEAKVDDKHELERLRRKFKMECPNGEYSKQDRAALKSCIGDDLTFKDSDAGKRLYGQGNKK